MNAEEICDLHLKLLDLINNTSENVCAQITYKLEFEETDLFPTPTPRIVFALYLIKAKCKHSKMQNVNFWDICPEKNEIHKCT